MAIKISIPLPVIEVFLDCLGNTTDETDIENEIPDNELFTELLNQLDEVPEHATTAELEFDKDVMKLYCQVLREDLSGDNYYCFEHPADVVSNALNELEAILA